MDPYDSRKEDYQMDVLEFRYENGHMTINGLVYFPGDQKHTRKPFPNIKRY